MIVYLKLMGNGLLMFKECIRMGQNAEFKYSTQKLEWFMKTDIKITSARVRKNEVKLLYGPYLTDEWPGNFKYCFKTEFWISIF